MSGGEEGRVDKGKGRRMGCGWVGDGVVGGKRMWEDDEGRKVMMGREDVMWVDNEVHVGRM